MSEQELLYTMAITRLLPLDAKAQQTLLQTMGSATAVFENRQDVSRIIADISPRAARIVQTMETQLPRCEKELEYARTHHIRVLAYGDEEKYPRRLRECEDAPLVLYALGQADFNARRIVSVVGTRRCTEYGRDLCRQLTADLARQLPGTLVVSGLAYGIDIAAHRAALAAGLPTVGVLAHGLDQVYPQLHRQTAIEMLAEGGLLTEFMTETRIEKINFVQRNRIVASLSDATIVVESAERGGSLITAEMANGYHREVFAFPGRPCDAVSAGCNHLIRSNGATLITSAADLITDLGWQPEPVQKELFTDADEGTGEEPAGAGAACLSPEEQQILQLLRSAKEDLALTQLTEATTLPTHRLTSLLIALEMKGMIKALPGNRYHCIK